MFMNKTRKSPPPKPKKGKKKELDGYQPRVHDLGPQTAKKVQE